jgi:hypothetical protein
MTTTATFNATGYQNAAEEIDVFPYPLTVTLVYHDQKMNATINGITFTAQNVAAYGEGEHRVRLHIDSGRYEAIAVIDRDEWHEAVARFNAAHAADLGKVSPA